MENNKAQEPMNDLQCVLRTDETQVVLLSLVVSIMYDIS